MARIQLTCLVMAILEFAVSRKVEADVHGQDEVYVGEVDAEIQAS